MHVYKIHGLYSGHAVIAAEDEEEARQRYHKEFPGWAGTIFSVVVLDDGAVGLEVDPE